MFANVIIYLGMYAKQQTIITALIAFLLGFIIAWMIFGRSPVAEAPIEESEEAGTSSLPAISKNEVSEEKASVDSDVISKPIVFLKEVPVVHDQPAGATVLVKEVVFGKPSWIVAREERKGSIGNILGALWLPSGTHQNREVELLRETVAGGMYYVFLHDDDGDKKFNSSIDLPITDSLGKPISVPFRAL